MPLSGSQVVQKHKQAIRNCQGQTGWDALSCIVDSMQQVYGTSVAGSPGVE